MFETYTTTTIEDTDIFCNLSVYKFWTKVKIIHHLDRHIKGYTTDISFSCKLCVIGHSDKDTIYKHMINHVKNVLKEDVEAKPYMNEVIE